MIAPSALLVAIPAGLRAPLLSSFTEITKNFSEQRWEPAELNGGKFCECVYSIIHGYLIGNYPAIPSKPSNMVQACQALERIPNPPSVGDRSFRIQVPRVLMPLYEIRNNRGVGHVGGDVNPNFMDAMAVLGMASWVLAELIRVFHAVSTAEAQLTVDALVERRHPLVWRSDDIRRVLLPDMPTKNQVLLLLNGEGTWIEINDLFKWVEYSGVGMFKTRVLMPLHKARYIEYDVSGQRAKITPLGVVAVEKILKQINIGLA